MSAHRRAIVAVAEPSFTPLQPSLGALVDGIDLRQPLTDELRGALRTALLRHCVLFFRDQAITREQHIAFGREFGELEVHPVFSHPDHPEILPLISQDLGKRYRRTSDSNWHADTTFREAPSAASILRALVSPRLGGDTVWVNVVAAYEDLDAETKIRIDGLTAVHDPRIFLNFLDATKKNKRFCGSSRPSNTRLSESIPRPEKKRCTSIRCLRASSSG